MWGSCEVCKAISRTLSVWFVLALSYPQGLPHQTYQQASANKNSPLFSISDPRLWTNIAVHESQAVQVTNCLRDNLTKPGTHLVWSKRLGNTQLYHRVAWSFSKCTTNNNHGWSFINCFYSLEDVWLFGKLTLARLTKNLFNWRLTKNSRPAPSDKPALQHVLQKNHDLRS